MSDDEGAWISHSNIGLCHGLLGDHTAATRHHQEALKEALKVQVEAMHLRSPVADRISREKTLGRYLYLIDDYRDFADPFQP